MPDSNSADLLRAIVSRIENAQEDIDNAKLDMKVIYSEAKSAGYDTKILRKIINRRKLGKEAVREEQELIDTYEAAISGQMKLPLDPADAPADSEDSAQAA